MGEGIRTDTKKRITTLVESDETVLRLMHILSTYQGPEEILLMLIVAFKPDLDTAEINDAIDRIREKIKAEYSLVRFVIIQPEIYMKKIDPDVQAYI
jgi:divalent metal cation (Fe/Co/Zn/Cd) transporter